MFNGIIYNQGLIKSIKKNPKYVSGSLVIEILLILNLKNLILVSQYVVMVFV